MRATIRDKRCPNLFFTAHHLRPKGRCILNTWQCEQEFVDKVRTGLHTIGIGDFAEPSCDDQQALLVEHAEVAGGEPAVHVLIVVLWLAGAILTGFLRPAQQMMKSGAGVDDDLYAGVRFIRSRPVILGAISLTWLIGAWFVIGGIFELAMAFAVKIGRAWLLLGDLAGDVEVGWRAGEFGSRA